MKRSTLIYIAAVAVLFALLLLEPRIRAALIVHGVFSAPIEFYGRVMDQHREPVADAEVEFGAANHFMEPSTKYSARSDSNGYFSITGIQGAALNVSISGIAQ